MIRDHTLLVLEGGPLLLKRRSHGLERWGEKPRAPLFGAAKLSPQGNHTPSMASSLKGSPGSFSFQVWLMSGNVQGARVERGQGWAQKCDHQTIEGSGIMMTLNPSQVPCKRSVCRKREGLRSEMCSDPVAFKLLSDSRHGPGREQSYRNGNRTSWSLKASVES